MRLFFAVPLSEAVRETVWSAVRRFPAADPPWRWIPPENYHLTLKFIGEVDERRADELREAGAEAAAGIAPFPLRFGRFGAFPDPARPRVIFFGIEEGFEPLAALAGRLEEACEALGIERESRPFRAHLTLARIKSPLPGPVREAMHAVPPLPDSTRQMTDRFVLMSSRLDRAGASYDELASWPLGPV
ncbi:MAG: RNA 2',3'-cyclic phosphodiesterase [Candidatus Krumholzibacteria bacterium]|nr:RNA 2',3'-cyclic phosphodiesterase [Candidatus Krumholzibacteria bacterium]